MWIKRDNVDTQHIINAQKTQSIITSLAAITATVTATLNMCLYI